MIEFFTAPAPNGWKVAIMLEECGLAYQPRWVDLAAGDQHSQEYLAINPNGRIPAITDHAPGDGGEPVTVFESGAVLLYLAEKAGRFLPTDLRGQSRVRQWLFWQVGHLGPTLGQHGHFHLYAEEKLPYAIERFHREALRVYGVMDRQLAQEEHLAGADYTIADEPMDTAGLRQHPSRAGRTGLFHRLAALLGRRGVQRGEPVGL